MFIRSVEFWMRIANIYVQVKPIITKSCCKQGHCFRWRLFAKLEIDIYYVRGEKTFSSDETNRFSLLQLKGFPRSTSPITLSTKDEILELLRNSLGIKCPKKMVFYVISRSENPDISRIRNDWLGRWLFNSSLKKMISSSDFFPSDCSFFDSILIYIFPFRNLQGMFQNFVSIDSGRMVSNKTTDADINHGFDQASTPPTSDCCLLLTSGNNVY